MPTLLVILAIVVAVALLVAPLALALVARRGVARVGAAHRLCGQCGYDVEPSLDTAARCPECGGVLAVVGVVDPGRQQARKVILTVTLLGLSLLVVVLGFTGLTIMEAASRQRAAEQAAAAAEQAARLREGAALRAAAAAAGEIDDDQEWEER